MLITGATGMVGNHVVRRALEADFRIRVLVRASADMSRVSGLDVDCVDGDLSNPATLEQVLREADYVVHPAAHVGDWGPAEKFRAINVIALEHMLTTVVNAGRLKRWIQISSLGVYPPCHHHGTDEQAPIEVQGLDGYTRTKAEAELVVRRQIDQHRLPAVVIRPGFIYGRGDRHVVPTLVERIQAGTMKLVGDGQRLLNNTSVHNLVDAILLAVHNERAVGEIFNVRDERLVSRVEFVGTVADYLGYPHPPHVPEWLARTLVHPIEKWARFRRATKAPMLTHGRIKFLTLNLDFSIDKAKRILGYQPRVDFQHGIREVLEEIRPTSTAQRGPAAA